MEILKKDRYFMQKALEQAQVAFKHNEIPIGAIVIDSQSNIIGKGYNQVEQKRCQIYHAETLAIKEACKVKQDWRLSNCTIYITLEPCVMCLGLICLSRIERVVYAAKSPLFGCNKEIMPALYQQHIKGITSGVMSSEAEDLLKFFFKQKRGENEKKE